ncbi:MULTISPECIES: transglutaminase-like cysteine peptidase [unclassified Achromobacter]|jgi:predicted transglutaminase-like cysteine proteinase|uniref:transglutaminase-like cysteine peptidase n=1 Tax=unclassified Achromobacter TaxID=2626865 RepID=UPI000B51CDDA|nr:MULTISPECIES: transglutaminase-like cysteine peptidase [unclassified Achromobacter]OWT79864.1 transglutaminase [Achromobacter sp. HZ34]OWT81748.1 transglutaminase [Achromobacter sp. HZ28]
MPSLLRPRAAFALCWMALICLVCGWGMSGALELDSHKLESLAASRYGAKGAERVASWLQLLQEDRDMAEPDKLASVNDFWNRRVMQAEDQVVWGVPDYWATPLEALGKGAGDCEDYVIGKYFSLIKLGVPTSKLRFVYVRARVGGPESTEQVAHMVLGYYPAPDAMPLVLDSLVSGILPASQRRDLVPIFSFNADGVYVDGKQAAPVDRIGRWRNLLQRMEREGIRP